MIRVTQTYIARVVTGLILLALIGGCATSPQFEERFAESSATTWRVAGEVKVFERTEARFSRSARDYVYLGPVAVNRQGSYEYLLWVGIASTLDRGFLAPVASLPDALTLFVDGEPLELNLIEWNQRVPGLVGEIPYQPPVAVQWHLAARVTLDQIGLLDGPGSDRLLLQTTNGASREYQLWNGLSNWQTFVAEAPR